VLVASARADQGIAASGFCKAKNPDEFLELLIMGVGGRGEWKGVGIIFLKLDERKITKIKIKSQK